MVFMKKEYFCKKRNVRVTRSECNICFVCLNKSGYSFQGNCVEFNLQSIEKPIEQELATV